MSFITSEKRLGLLLFSCLLFTLLTTSCNTTKNLVYFRDLPQAPEAETKINNSREPVIQPDDLLGITVSSLNPESNILFNSGTLVTPGANSSAGGTAKANEGYLVDQAGAINFPVLGKVVLGGLTKAQATEKMETEVKKYVKNPIINIRFINFKITVLGEVERPASYTIPTERINVIEALGLAGDMTVYGKRDNVLVIREKNGIRSTARLNLSSKTSFDSPYFYLQQNDVVYVEPDKAKNNQINNTRNDIAFAASIVAALGFIISLLI